MKSLFFVLSVVFFLGTFSAGLSQKRVKMRDATHGGGDTTVIPTPEYLKVEGKSALGIRPNLEGTWVLESIPGNVNATKLSKPFSEKQKLTNATEVTSDTIMVDGYEVVTTTLHRTNTQASNNKYTPVQGDKMHVPAKPSIRFYGSNETFSGYTGCNKMAGRYVLSGSDRISLANATASTRMPCLGQYDEEAFLNVLHRVKSYKAVENRLIFMDGDNELVTFVKQ